MTDRDVAAAAKQAAKDYVDEAFRRRVDWRADSVTTVHVYNPEGEAAFMAGVAWARANPDAGVAEERNRWERAVGMSIETAEELAASTDPMPVHLRDAAEQGGERD